MHIAYLSSRLTLPTSSKRRADAFEHDHMMECLTSAFTAKGSNITAISWDDRKTDWSQFDAAIIGSTWDYQDRYGEFLGVLENIEKNTRLFNPRQTVEWNSRKTYLCDLAGRGTPTIPTQWHDTVDANIAKNAFCEFHTDDLIFKRQIGANAEGQFKLKRGETVPFMPEPMMIQPFLSSIKSEGELSFVYIDGDFSHALRKTAANGEYRIQSSYGGSEVTLVPDAADRTKADEAMMKLPEAPLYARVDMARDDSGDLLLMELELIEPYLYPLQATDLGERIYCGIARRLR